jgi:UDP-N-acetyl-D-mannosaminuronic acid transferase (WecB/TagA/CpsF family)
MSSDISSQRNREWLASESIDVSDDDVYIAPLYGSEVEDPQLLAVIRDRNPRHIVVTLGGGTQERLGLYLKQNLDHHPAIHCIGAAIGFLSGDQVKIPVWADKLFMGWLFRCLSEPKRYVARYWSARKLLPLLLKYRDRLPSAKV